MNRWFAAAFLAAAACSPADPAGTPNDAGAGCLFNCSEASFDGPLWRQVQGTIDQTCASGDNCHLGGSGGMALSVGNEFGPMIGVPSSEMPAMLRVAPGDPLHSYVYLKLRCEGGIQQSCMPLGISDPSLARVFHDWIEAGAPTQ